jgi:hypothetical protein
MCSGEREGGATPSRRPGRGLVLKPGGKSQEGGLDLLEGCQAVAVADQIGEVIDGVLRLISGIVDLFFDLFFAVRLLIFPGSVHRFSLGREFVDFNIVLCDDVGVFSVIVVLIRRTVADRVTFAEGRDRDHHGVLTCWGVKFHLTRIVYDRFQRESREGRRIFPGALANFSRA